MHRSQELELFMRRHPSRQRRARPRLRVPFTRVRAVGGLLEPLRQVVLGIAEEEYGCHEDRLSSGSDGVSVYRR